MSISKTTDWEEVFEDPEKGLVPLIMQAPSPETLKQMTQVVIQKLHLRQNEDENIGKLTAELDRIIPDTALANDLPLMQAKVTTLLREIKRERQRAAAAYRVRQYTDGSRDRRARRPAPRKKLFWRTRPTKRLAGAMAAAVLAVVAVTVLIAQNTGLSPEREAQGREAVRWVQNFVQRNLPMTSLRLESVKIRSGSIIEMSVIVSKSRDSKLFSALKANSRMVRADVLRVVCPSPKSGVYKYLDQGWKLRVVFRGQNETLADGGCQYQRARS